MEPNLLYTLSFRPIFSVNPVYSVSLLFNREYFANSMCLFVNNYKYFFILLILVFFWGNFPHDCFVVSCDILC